MASQARRAAWAPFAWLAMQACHRGPPPSSNAEAGAAVEIEAGASPGDAAVAGDAAPALDGGTTGIADASASGVDPFGLARTSTRAACGALVGNQVASADRTTSFVDGDDLLALVNRSPTGQLAPEYAPTDLVDIRNGKAASASDCEKMQCLRKDASAALDELLVRMKAEGFPGKVESAFRSYGAQCGTFASWAHKSSFCEATEQSALPGHSQHQLGTTVDLFTEEWAKDPRGVFREGFGCTPAGRWIREHATELGYVMPYPINPDDRHRPKRRASEADAGAAGDAEPNLSCAPRFDIPVSINPRTGYRYEHWHIRFVGKDAALRFRTAYLASQPGKPSELSVEQWLRAEKGINGPDAELPVCDGCNCGACASLGGDGICEKRGGVLHLDPHGKPVVPEASPTLASAARARGKKWKGGVVEAKLDVPAGTLTQPPIVGLDGTGYAAGATFEKLAPYPETEPRAYPPLASAWVVAVEPVPNDTGVAWPWRAAIATTAIGQTYDKANVVLPARTGAVTVRVPIPAGVAKAKVTLLRAGEPVGTPRDVDP